MRRRGVATCLAQKHGGAQTSRGQVVKLALLLPEEQEVENEEEEKRRGDKSDSNLQLQPQKRF